MLTPAESARCPLCDCALHPRDVSAHLRALHEVALGEATRADVPVGRWSRTHEPPFPSIEEFEDELMAAGVA